MNNIKKSIVNKLVKDSSKSSFRTNISIDEFKKGIDESIIKLISEKKNEPPFMLEFRLEAFKKWKKIIEPSWAAISYPKINYQNIRYYSSPKNFYKNNQIDEKLIKTFKKLGISLEEKKTNSNLAMDIVFDSVSLTTTFKYDLAKTGIIFCSISEAIIKYPDLIKKYLGSVVPSGDNFFTALNSAIFTDGSFCYIPKNIVCPFDLSTYFRINDEESGQFERTLIIAEENSSLNYLEGCTAPKYDTNQLHAAIVELVALDNAFIKYSTVQNWYAGNEEGNGGIFNFVTKRGLCAGKNSRISWTQIETGSAITWKYPSCILSGFSSIGEFYSVAITNKYQQSDTGTKMFHLASRTKSTIISKGISLKNSKNTYRGLVKITENAKKSRNFSQCDSLLFGNNSAANTFPYIIVDNSTSKVEHEASTSKIGDDQLFYLAQRGLNEEEAINLIVGGFCKEVFLNLPLEFSIEANKLLNLKLEGAIG